MSSSTVNRNVKSFNIAIVGGGIAGLTLAIALHRRNIPFQIYEQTDAFREIGAGVSISPNAVAAMELCDDGIPSISSVPGVLAAYNKTATPNGWPEKQNIWFDYYDGMSRKIQDKQDILFSIKSAIGQRGLHRAQFLDELVKVVPTDRVNLDKKLEDIQEDPSTGKLKLVFTNGTSAEADAVIGCDGIRSRVRSILVGKDHPSANPSYSHKYAYRGVVPMEKAVEAIGEEKARNSHMFLGKSGHVLTFPVAGGKTFNMVAFFEDKNEWEDVERMTRISTREEALKDFKDFGPDVLTILNLVQPELPVWAIFDSYENPLQSFYKNRIAVIGDAAHATSPHHGSGAGFAIEDSAFIAELLADEHVQRPKDIEAVFATYDEVRRERAQWLVRSSRFVGNADAGLIPELGTDYKKVHQEIEERYERIISFNPRKETVDARKVLYSKLGAFQRHNL